MNSREREIRAWLDELGVPYTIEPGKGTHRKVFIDGKMVTVFSISGVMYKRDKKNMLAHIKKIIPNLKGASNASQ